MSLATASFVHAVEGSDMRPTTRRPSMAHTSDLYGQMSLRQSLIGFQTIQETICRKQSPSTTI